MKNNKRIPHEVKQAVKEDLIEGKLLQREIALKHGISKSYVADLNFHVMFEGKLMPTTLTLHTGDRKYYKNESEIWASLRPNYRPEQLTGDELKMYNEL